MTSKPARSTSFNTSIVSEMSAPGGDRIRLTRGRHTEHRLRQASIRPIQTVLRPSVCPVLLVLNSPSVTNYLLLPWSANRNIAPIRTITLVCRRAILLLHCSAQHPKLNRKPESGRDSLRVPFHFRLYSVFRALCSEYGAGSQDPMPFRHARSLPSPIRQAVTCNP